MDARRNRGRYTTNGRKQIARVCGGEGISQFAVHAGLWESKNSIEIRARIGMHEFKEAGKDTIE